MSITLKLKFKIELANKLLKPNEEYGSMKDSRNKSKTSLIKTSEKNSIRTSKIISANDYDSLPGYEAFISKLPPDDRDELNACLKVYNINTLTSVFGILQSKKLYTRLKSKTGIELLRSHYRDSIKKLQDSNYISDECELYLCLKDYLEMTDLDCMDLFDLFKFNEYFAFTEQCFMVLIYLLTSNECGYLTDFFQHFNDELFNIISGGENAINVSRLKDVGRLLGINERMLAAHAKDMGFEFIVERSQFREFYTTLLKTSDEKVQYNTLMANKKQGVTPKGTCYNKTCNIL
jgi:hypothetical protein